MTHFMRSPADKHQPNILDTLAELEIFSFVQIWFESIKSLTVKLHPQDLLGILAECFHISDSIRSENCSPQYCY